MEFSHCWRIIVTAPVGRAHFSKLMCTISIETGINIRIQRDIHKYDLEEYKETWNLPYEQVEEEFHFRVHFSKSGLVIFQTVESLP